VTLSLRAVTYRYAGAETPAVRDVDLELEPGRIVGVAGANGAGKSTLCLAAVGLAPAVVGGTLSGSVDIDGMSTATTPMHQLAQRAGVLFQEAQAQISGTAQTVWEEVAFGPRNLSLPLEDVVDRTSGALAALDIEDLAERDPSRLSGGQAQLVALAGVLALRPKYLVLDEPTSQLDPHGTRLVATALVRAVAATGAGVLIAEHKTELLATLCDDVVVLHDGVVVRHGRAADVLADDTLADLGVAPPAPIALRRAVESAGVSWDEAWA
jgi:energy-coupling factor transport system ATP-binding protein